MPSPSHPNGKTKAIIKTYSELYHRTKGETKKRKAPLKPDTSLNILLCLLLLLRTSVLLREKTQRTSEQHVTDVLYNTPSALVITR